jgi:hypothetical protein
MQGFWNLLWLSGSNAIDEKADCVFVRALLVQVDQQTNNIKSRHRFTRLCLPLALHEFALVVKGAAVGICI